MKQPRWLNRIVLQETGEITSYCEKRGWAGEIPVKITSILDPPGTVNSGRSANITGIAFAGVRGVRSVEVSLDGGENWKACELVEGGGPNVWALWRFRWSEPDAGPASVSQEVDVIQVESTGRNTY